MKFLNVMTVLLSASSAIAFPDGPGRKPISLKVISQKQTAPPGVSPSASKNRRKARPSVAVGDWGGRNIRLSVTENGATIEYDCANGTIEQPLLLDRDGRFDVRGTVQLETGGAVTGISIQEEGKPATAAPDSARARYRGQVRGRTMSLLVELTGNKTKFGTFSLIHSATPRLFKCQA